jgi:hypothetical protein
MKFIAVDFSQREISKETNGFSQKAAILRRYSIWLKPIFLNFI